MAFKYKFKEFQPIKVNDEIILRQVQVENDLENYFEMYNNQNIARYYPAMSGKFIQLDAVRRIIENQINAFEKRREYIWTIAYIKSNEAIGRISLSEFEANNKIANIGYFINQEHWKKGIISSCIQPVVEFGFSYLELERIYTTVHVDNIASCKALEKNGFSKEGILRHSFNLPSGLSDCYMYSKLYND